MIILILQSFVGSYAQNPVNFHELNEGEIINFQSKPVLTKNSHSGWYKRGAYDLSSYNINIDTQGHLNVSELKGCNGKHQGEILLLHSKGNITRILDTIKVQAKTIYDKYYIIGIKENGIIDSFSADIKFDLISKTLKNSYCPNLVSIRPELDICALPKGVKKNEVWKPIHKDNTIGEFAYFAVIDSEGKSLIFPQGDYVIIGADTLSLSR
jgi:hypothetical protein